METATVPRLPWRGAAAQRPDGIAIPPASMPLFRARRMLKRWRYVGFYGPEAMLCVGSAHVGPTWQVWWAVWDRGERRLHERTRMLAGRGRVEVEEAGRVHVGDGGVTIDLELDEGAGVETVTPAGGAWIWTRKQGHVPARGAVTLEGRRLELDGRAFVDESAGYHDRVTSWRWSAGTGVAAGGELVAWNLSDGIHDSLRDSERTIWVDGAAREVGPVRFGEDLGSVAFREGGRLDCHAEATRARDDNLLVFRSRYAQPFGTFSGTLPGGVELAEGYGVMESHDVRW
ncbi:MAG: hypothetical protein QOG35_1182 [Solirubrobacteraceae bacterium]|jgi:hypothetical protein|nr:hypothetical protein [Solirubrobacteraceae bacterium]